jgi:hypothetical protein
VQPRTSENALLPSAPDERAADKPSSSKLLDESASMTRELQLYYDKTIGTLLQCETSPHQEARLVVLFLISKAFCGEGPASHFNRTVLYVF